MPRIAADRMQDIVAALLEAAGASEHEARTVARFSVAANLAGHDSHGVIQIPTHIARIGEGRVGPAGSFEIERETGPAVVVNGDWGSGYVVAERTMRRTIEKARTRNVGAATIAREGHSGRVAAYPMVAAEAGMIALM